MSRHVEFKRVHNFRDLGGYATDDGRVVRSERMFRADSLAKLDDDGDWERFVGLGIRTISLASTRASSPAGLSPLSS